MLENGGSTYGSGGNGGSAGDVALLHDMPHAGPARWFLATGVIQQGIDRIR